MARGSGGWSKRVFGTRVGRKALRPYKFNPALDWRVLGIYWVIIAHDGVPGFA